MGSMTKEEYTTKFLEILKLVLYLKDDKAKVQQFVKGFPLTFRDQIEYDEPRSIEEVIGKLKHFYERSKCKNESQKGWKGKDKVKGKWQLKRARPQNVDEKENIAPKKRFNVARHGHGSQ